MKTKKILLALPLFIFAAVVAQATTKQWVHVHVENPAKEEKVRINIPISLVETMLPMIEEKGIKNGRIELQDKDLKVEELKRVWKEVRELGDNEYASIQSKDTSLTVFTRGNFLMVQPTGDSKTNIDIKLPLEVVDAMLSGEGNQLNLTAAVRALKQSGVRDIITIKNEETSVRVWIDENNIAK